VRPNPVEPDDTKTTPGKGLCALCQDLQRGYLIVPPSKLKDGIENGCKVCALLKESVARFRDIDSVYIFAQ
jgi:hypothetical protein